MPVPSKPTLLIDPPDTGTGKHDYYDRLRALPSCLFANAMRSEADLDALPTTATIGPRLPIVYDPEVDAALFVMHPAIKTDTQQKTAQFSPVGAKTLLLTWDFRFNDGFAWRVLGDLFRHKTWRIDPGPWVALKTDYKETAHNPRRPDGAIAELWVNVPGLRFIAPGSSRDGERLLPRVGQFFLQADTWCRIWVLIEQADEPMAQLSVWAADVRTPPVQLHDRNPLFTPPAGVSKLLFEYDASKEQATNPEMRSWNRNLVVLKGFPLADALGLLERPT